MSSDSKTTAQCAATRHHEIDPDNGRCVHCGVSLYDLAVAWVAQKKVRALQDSPMTSETTVLHDFTTPPPSGVAVLISVGGEGETLARWSGKVGWVDVRRGAVIGWTPTTWRFDVMRAGNVDPDRGEGIGSLR